MDKIDKNQAIVDYLLQCENIKDSPLYFNFVNMKNNNKQIITMSSDISTDKKFVDGSILRRYTFTIVVFKSIAPNAIVTQVGHVDENVEDLNDVQMLIDWITEQNEKSNYPNFGTKNVVQDIKALSNSPRLDGIDTQANPPLAQYSTAIRVEYLDKSNMIWE